MKTFEFKSERNWDRAYDYLDEIRAEMTSYGYCAITVFNKSAENELVKYCKAHRIAIKEA